MNDVRWTRGGQRGGGAQLPEQRTGTIRLSALLRFWAPDLSVMETAHLFIYFKKFFLMLNKES